MALATITGNRSDIAGLADKTDKLWFKPTIPSADVLSPRRVPAVVGDDGSFSVQLHPGPASVTIFNKSVPFVVPADGGTYTLWSRIAATIELPPETTQAKLEAAVAHLVATGATDILTEEVASATYAPIGSVGRTTLQRDIREFVEEGENFDVTGAVNVQPIFARAVEDAAHPLGIPVQLVVPAGQFRLNTSIPWVSKVGLKGAGRTETVLLPYGTACAIEALTAFEWDGTSYIDDAVFTDFTIDGSHQVDAAYNASIKGFFIQNMRRARFERVNVSHTWGTGFGVDFLQDATFSDCYASDCGRGWQVIYSLTNPAGTPGNGSGSGFGIGVGRNAVETVTLNNCVSVDNWVNGYFTEQLVNRGAAYKSKGFSMNACVARGNKTGFLDAGSENAAINGACQFIENYYAGVQIGITIAEIPGGGHGGVVQGCNILRNGNPATGSGGNVILNDARNGRYTFDANNISDSYGPGVWGNSSGTLGPDMVFSRNRIRGNAKAGILIQMAADVTRLKLDNNDVSNNCANADVTEKAGVTLLCGLINPTITNNTIYDDRTTKFQDRGLDLRGSDRNLVLPRIQGNTFVGNGVEPMRNQRTPSTTDYINNNILSTTPDLVAPTAPTGLAASAISVSTVHIAGTPGTDNIGVSSYDWIIGGVVVATSSGASVDLAGLTPGTAYSVTAKAVDAAGNRSAASSAVAFSTLAYGWTETGAGSNRNLEGGLTETGGKTYSVIKGSGIVGDPTITSNRVACANAASTVLLAADVGTPNMRFIATLLSVNTAGNIFIFVRGLDINNYINLQRKGSSAGQNTYLINQKVNSTNTTLYDSGITMASNDVIEIWFTETTTGVWTTMHVKINATEIWSGVVTPHTTRTLAGVGWGSASATATFDNLAATAA